MLREKQEALLPFIWGLVIPDFGRNDQKEARRRVSSWRCEFGLFFRDEAQYAHWSDTESEISDSSDDDMSNFEQPFQIEQLVDMSDAGDVSMSSTGMGPWSVTSSEM